MIGGIEFDLIYLWHVFLHIMLLLLLLAKLFQFKQLKPSLIAESLSAELDHFNLNLVEWRYIYQKLIVSRLNICDNAQVYTDFFICFMQNLLRVFIKWLQLFHESISFPSTPWLQISDLNKVLEVLFCPISKQLKNCKLSNRLFVRFYS